MPNIGGLAGNPYTLFGIAPAWVNTALAPGKTPQVLASSVADVVRSFTITFDYQIFSPNLVWFLIAFWQYTTFPYDFDAFPDDRQ